jgi:nucleotide-binding universal stress UspA family protein
MKQILVATDFSVCASNAMEYALYLAKKLDRTVAVVHAIGANEGVENNILNAFYIKEYQESKKGALSKWILTFTDKEEFKGITVQTVCEVGSVSGVISKYVSENPVGILVMGMVGSSGITDIFGSNVHTMISKALLPTLIVPIGTKFEKTPVITLATDFETKISEQDVAGLTGLVQGIDDNRLQVLNVIEGNAWRSNEKGEQELRQLFNEIALSFVYISEESAGEGILNFISSNNTSILCLVKHHHNIIYRIFNSSTVNKVLSKSIKAILVLHA